MPRPETWRDGCVWERGKWTREKDGEGFTYTDGRLVCPERDPRPGLDPRPGRDPRPATDRGKRQEKEQ